MSSNITIITGSCSKYFQYLKKMLNSINKYEIKRIIIYDLGIKNNEMNELNKIKNKYKNDIIIENFNFENYADHVDLRKYYGKFCSYAWKPIIINEVCNKYKGIVFWFDTLTLFDKHIYKLFNILKNETPIYTPTSAGNIRRWTYPTCLKYIDGEKYLDKKSRAGGCFGVNYDNKIGKILVDKWKKYSLIRECICPKGSNRSNHRQDQTILSIIYYELLEKYEFKVYNNYLGYSIHNY